MKENHITEFLYTLVKTEMEDDSLSLTPNTKIESLGMNSISFIKILVEVEGKYDIELDDEELDFDESTSIGDLVGIVINRISKVENLTLL